MKEPKLTPILENQGFRNIAKAIRQSTITLQYIGRKNSDYDIRYGLGQDLKRKSQYAEDFIQALADFMQSYNEENARVHERAKGKPSWRRTVISIDDITDVVSLLDSYKPETICNLLVAFGYASAPKEKPDETMGTLTDEPVAQ